MTVLTVAAGAVAALTVAPAGAEPEDTPGAAQAGARVDRLYAEAERVTEKYNGAAERAGALRAELTRIQERAARGQQRVNRLRGDLGALAGAQYRSGGLDPTVELLLSRDPDAYLDRAAALDRISSNQSGTLRSFEGARRTLEQSRQEGAGKLTELERQRTALRRHKKAVRQKLADARRLLDQLTPRERADRERAGRGNRTAAPPPLAGSGSAGSSARGAAAVAAARGAVGSPYGWGKAGPNAFDCSGLTQWAYGRAGISIPRTSQAQASAGRRVPLSAIRPGDLVVYRDDASHVAMYVGGGQVVHAPKPGAQVRYDPVRMMPVSAVARP